MKSKAKIITILLFFAVGTIMLYVSFFWPETWSIPYWFGQLPSIPLFWRRFLLINWILIIVICSFFFVRRQEKK
jgi:hypothetical protein